MEHEYIDGECRAMEAAETVPHFMVSLDESKRMFEEFKTFVGSQMVSGEDFGVIPGTGNKPTLLKPGAEKLANLFGLAIHYERTAETSTKEFVRFGYRCTLKSRKTGAVVSECDALANSEEQERWGKNPLKFENTIAKICQKRALVGAVLHATRASTFFTQDLEDMGSSSDESAESLKCADCGNEIEGYTSKAGKTYTAADVARFSTKDYGKALCSKCGFKAKNAKEEANTSSD